MKSGISHNKSHLFLIKIILSSSSTDYRNAYKVTFQTLVRRLGLGRVLQQGGGAAVVHPQQQVRLFTNSNKQNNQSSRGGAVVAANGNGNANGIVLFAHAHHS
jgi:tRNA1(Val) A37 N6-methylase TrmN6